MVRWAHPSPNPKRNLDGFSLFAGLTILTDRQTDRRRDHAVCNNKPTVQASMR